MRNRSLYFLSLMCAALACGGASAGEAYPSRPVRIIIPFSPGGGADQLARTLQPSLATALGQSLVLDNRSGASGIIGAEMAARSTPDGYTVLMITTTHSVNPALMGKLPYDLVKDLKAVSMPVTQPNVLVVHPSLPAKSMRELVALAKSSKSLTYASGGNGSAPHLSGALLQMVANVDLIHVPFKGAGPGIAAVVGNQVTMMFVGPLGVEAHVKSGRLRALAVADKKRSAVLPDVPTVAEAGYPGTEAGTWYGFMMPAGTARSVIDAFHSAVLTAMSSPDTKARLLAQGAEIVGAGPNEFDPFIRAEIAKWTKLIQATGIKAN